MTEDKKADMYNLESHYEVVITGTDLTSSLLAAAVGRIGKSVLHFDSEKKYGKEWGTMSFLDLLLWPTIPNTSNHNDIDHSEICDQFNLSKENFYTYDRKQFITNIECSFPVLEDRDEMARFLSLKFKNPSSNQDSKAVEFFEEFEKFYNEKIKNKHQDALKSVDELKEKYSTLSFGLLDNSFNIDLCPRFLFSHGNMVDILISSDASRYLEFRKVSRILTPISSSDSDNKQFKIINVPCTRSDIFKSKDISMLEKRYLMKFITMCYDFQKNEETLKQFLGKPFEEFLQSQQLTPLLRDLIVNSVLMADPTMSTEEALKQINLFLRSIGRFSDRPFIYPLYGSGEIVQSMCRYAAIYGVTYCLQVPFYGVVLNQDTNQCKTIVTKCFQVNCDYLITDYQLTNNTNQNQVQFNSISRAIVCSTRSISENGLSENLDNTTIMYLPAKYTNSNKSVYIFETGDSTKVCPNGMYIQYFWCETTSTAKEDLESVIKLIFELKSDKKEKTKTDTSTDDQIKHIEMKNEEPSSDEVEQQQLESKTEVNQEVKTFQNTILWTVYFDQHYQKVEENDELTETELAKNIFKVNTPVNELDYQYATEQARTIFKQMYPEEEFFPVTKKPVDPTNIDEDFI